MAPPTPTKVWESRGETTTTAEHVVQKGARAKGSVCSRSVETRETNGTEQWVGCHWDPGKETGRKLGMGREMGYV